MKWGNWSAARPGLLLVIGTLFATVGAYASAAPAAAKANRGRLAIVWPGVGFPGYKLVVSGRASGWGNGALVVLEWKERRAWRPVGQARLNRAGDFVVSWRAPKAVGPVALRLALHRRSRVLAQRSAKVRIRPLPIVIPASEITSAPAPGHAGWIRFKNPGGRAARAASGGSGCVRVPTGPTVYQSNFVAVGYNAQTSPSGFLGKINLVQCGGLTSGIYATPVPLDQAVGAGSLDLSAGFGQKAGNSSSRSASKSFTHSFGNIQCSGSGSATLSGNVAISVVPTLKVVFSGFSVSSAVFQVTGSASASIGVDANAGAKCSLAPVALIKGYYPIATFEGQVGPFPVVVELRGQLYLSGSVSASVDASDQISANATVTGGVQYANHSFSIIKGSSFALVNSGPTLSGTADAWGQMSPQIQALLYGVAGPQLAVHAGVHLHADTTANPWWTVTAPVSVDAAFTGFGRTSGSLVLYQHTFSLAAANGPFGGSTASVNITNPGNQTGATGRPVSLQIQASDTDGAPLTYSAVGLPPGLSIAPTSGLISGTPTSSATFNVTVTATDASGPSQSTSFTWTVAATSAWSIQPTPNPSGSQFVSRLIGVSCTASTSCVAVGWNTPNNSTPAAPLAETWDGTAWTIQTSASTGVSSGSLIGVSCASTTYCVAVGDGTLAEVWNGTTFSIDPSTSPAGATQSRLNSVSCTSTTTCMAVGWVQDMTGTISPLAESWDGNGWALEPTPNAPSGDDVELNSVSCASAANCTAVGFDAHLSAPLAEHWDGTSWTTQTLPTTAATKLNAVSCPTTTMCLALGDDGIGSAEALLWNGTSWSALSSQPTLAGGDRLTALSCSAATSCVAGGYTNGGTRVEQWDGTTWLVASTPNPPNALGSLWGVSCPSSSFCEAVGDYNAGTSSASTLAESGP